MESVEETEKVPEKPSGFFNYVFGFDTDSKNEMFNMLQYSLYSIIPILFLLRVLENMIPDFDPNKNYLENLAESLGQLGIIILGIWFIDRIIRYFPTYSKTNYHPLNASFIIPFIIIIATKQTKLGLKLNSVIDKMLVSDSFVSNSSSSSCHQQKINDEYNIPLGPPAAIDTQQTNQAKIHSTAPLIPINRELTGPPTEKGLTFPSQFDNTPTSDMAFEPVAANGDSGYSGLNW